MSRPVLEVADIFRGHGGAWRQANAGHVSLGQLKVMAAIENCRTAALGGHVARCENDNCAYTQIAYNSCRNRHCPKCQGAAAREWLAEREAELLPVPYFHVVFSLPAQIADIAYHNKAAIYDILFKASAETLIAIAADPKHLGARVGVLSVLHTWGSALTHHPHVHMIVPGGGISLDGTRWVTCRPNFFLSVRVLSRLFRRLLLEKLASAHLSREDRDETKATASALGASTTLYRLACTDDEAWRRIEHRNRNLNGDLFISRETFETLKARFEPLSDDEERIDVLVDPSPIISGWRYRIA
jgi:Transposase zinc-binding domain/Putative transposase